MKSNTPIIQRGFTLIEMMIVVAIVAILTVIALPSYNRYIERGDATEAKAEILKVQSILMQERLRNPAHILSTASGIRTRIAATGASQITLSQNVAEKYELGVGGSDDAPVLTLTPRSKYASSRTLGVRVDVFSNAFICANSEATRAMPTEKWQWQLLRQPCAKANAILLRLQTKPSISRVPRGYVARPAKPISP